MALFRGRAQPETSTRQTPSVTRTLSETVEGTSTMPSGVPESDRIVITIARQCGSGGTEIGHLLARQSGLHYLDHEIIDEVARRSSMAVEDVEKQDEQTSGSLGHVLAALNSNMPFNLNYSQLLQPRAQKASGPTYEQAYFHLTQRVVLEMASTGDAVIIGRGGQFLLRGLPRILHVSIFAPLPRRIENVMQHFQLSHSEAIEFIERRDGATAHYLRHYYGSDGNRPELYHLLINTGLFSFEMAAHLIAQALPLIREIR